MTDVELERMFIRLVGDGSSFQKMLLQAQASAVDVASRLEQATTRIEGFQRSIAAFATSAVGALGSLGLVSSLRGAFDKYAEYESNTIKLNAAIQANAKDVQATMIEYKAFATELGRVTTMTSGATMAMARMAEARGMSTEKTKGAIQFSVALSGAMGGEASQHMHLAMAIMEGNTHMLRRALHLHNVKDEGELLARAQKILQSGWEVEQERAKSLSGMIEKLGNSFKELNREVGKVIAEYVRPLIEWMQRTIRQFKDADESTKKLAVSVVLLALAIPTIGPAIAAVGLAARVAAGPLMSLFGTGVWLAKVALSTAYLAASTVAFGAWTATVFTAKVAMAAFSAVMFAFSLISKLPTLSMVAQAVVIAGLTAAMFIAKGVTLLWNVAIAVFSATMVVGGAIIGIWTFIAGAMTAGQLLGKIATWAWNSALTVFNALISAGLLIIPVLVASIVAFASAGTVAVGVFGAIATVGLAAWTTVMQLKDVFASIPVDTGPIAGLTDTVGSLKDSVMLVVRAVKVDMPLAWEIAKVAANLAYNQVKDLWPPLWEYLKGSFNLVWEMVKVSAIKNFSEAYDQVYRDGLIMLDKLIDKSKAALVSLARFNLRSSIQEKKDIEAELERISEERTTRKRNEGLDETIRKTKEKLADLGKTLTIVPSADTEAAKAALDKLKEKLVKAEIDAKKKTEDVPLKLPPIAKIPDQKVAVKLDATEFGKAEAMARIRTYRDTFRDAMRLSAPGVEAKAVFGKEGDEAGAAAAAEAAAAKAGPPAAEPGWKATDIDTVTKLFEEMRDALVALVGKPPIDVEGVEFG